jgi:signal transduction histidine kinase
VTAHKPIVLHKEVAQPLPPVLADRSRIVQVFLRLVGNAARFMSRGGTITIRGEPTVDGARFSVTDTGPGIPEAHREHLFARHAPAGRRACQGTGLGVFVAKGIVEAHGGTVGAESEPGRGSTLYFTLPAVDPEQFEEEVS